MNAQLIAMCYMCVMMTEIETIEGGQKRCLLTRGDQKLKKNYNVCRCEVLVKFQR